MALDNPAANIEFAKLLWTEGKQSEAIKTISEVLSGSQLADNKAKAKVQLQYANWLDESNHLSAHQIVDEYKRAFELIKSMRNLVMILGNISTN